MSFRALAIPLALIVLLPTAMAVGTAPTATYLIGFEPGGGNAAIGLVHAAGGEVFGRLDALNTIIVSLPTAAAARLPTRGAISFVELDVATVATGAEWSGSQWDGAEWNGAEWNGAQWDGAEWNGAEWNGAQWDGTTDPGLANGWQWGLEAIRAPDAWAVQQGARGATICVTDSGVDGGHRDLAPNMGRSFNALTNITNADEGGHGTHVAGIASAVHLDGWGIGGVSNSTIMSAKVLHKNGTGSSSALARGLTWCGDNGADVVLMALTLSGSSLTVARAIDRLVARDVVIVASAGNNGPCLDCVSYPARDPRVIAVAATGQDGALASFSSKGPQVLLRAPGVGILSTLPGGAFGYGSGTSQAAAFAAGAAALVLEEHPSLTSAGVRAALVAGSTGGVLNVSAALLAASG